MIRINNLNKYYKSGQGTYHALRDINLTLPDKGMVFIVGKSGSGKSTLLNVIGGLDSYDKGELLIDDINTKNFSKSDYNAYRNTYIGFIFQEFNVIKNLSIYDNIALSIELHHESVKEHHQEILDMIDRVGLKGKEKRKMNEISGGERQRVAIARALIKNPKVIIADEPTGNLDIKNRNIIMNLLKDLAKERLVLIVTHDRYIADEHGDRIITIKDGSITDDHLLHSEVTTNENKKYEAKAISPSIKTSFNLAMIGVWQNKVRFLLIIFLFSFSLIFASSSVNLSLTDSSKEYAEYQSAYNNFVIDITKPNTNYGYDNETGLYNFDTEQLKIKYQTTSEQEGFEFLKSMIFNFNINLHDNAVDWKYQDTIERIIVHSDITNLEKLRAYKDEPRGVNFNQYGVYITDYVADCLLYYNYFDNIDDYDRSTGDERLEKFDQIIGECLTIDYLNHPLYIKNIIITDYQDFLSGNMSDTKVSVAFMDNLPYYSSIFTTSTIYNNIVMKDLDDVANFKYAYDNFIFDAFSQVGTYDNIKIMPYDPDTMEIAKSYDEEGNLEVNSDGSPVYLGSAPLKPEENRPTQLAVSRGFLEKVLGLDSSDYLLKYENNDKNYVLEHLSENYAYFYMLGYSRVPTPLNFIVTGVIESNDVIIYTPSLTTNDYFVNYLKNSYSQGDNSAGYPLLLINEDASVNAKLYKTLASENIIIKNESYKKLQIVNTFIDNNLILFIGLFFIFCLFSILIIFNFIIINIKNSTKDIGIYMSLGMNGFKISLIYLFQVLFISLLSIIISLIGTAIFLNVLDANFSAEALVDFKIINFTGLGSLVIILLAILTPVLSVIFPLLSLSRKRPIDVIKFS